MNTKRVRQAFLLLFLTFQISSGIYAQEQKLLGLKDAIEAALQNNKSIQIAKMDESIASSKYKQTEAIYLPQIGVSYSALSTNNPLNAFGFKLQQKSISAADFNPDLLNHPVGTPDFTTKLEIQQPLINIDLWFQKKAAAKQTEIYQFQTQRTKEYISLEVEKAFLQLGFSYQMVKVLEDALQTTKAIEKFTNDHYQQGLIQKSDLLNTQVRVRSVETNLQKAKSNISNASDYLSLLMGTSTGSLYTIQADQESDLSIPGKIDGNRADFKAMQTAIETADLAMEASRKSYLPKLNAFGSYQLNDSRMLGFGANAYLAGIQLSWDIFKGNRTKNSISTQILERNKMTEQLVQQKDQSQLELDKANRDLSDAKSEILQQQMAVEQSSEALRILQNRYQQGLVNTTDVLMAATQLSQQKLALTQAEFAFKMTNAYRKFLTASAK